MGISAEPEIGKQRRRKAMTTASLVTCQASFSGCYRHHLPDLRTNFLRQIHSQVRKSGPRRRDINRPCNSQHGETYPTSTDSKPTVMTPYLLPCPKDPENLCSPVWLVARCPILWTQSRTGPQGFLFNPAFLADTGSERQRGWPQVTSLSKRREMKQNKTA